MPMTLPILPTAIVGSYAMPGWLERLKTDYFARRISRHDLDEIYDAAVKAAIKDQETAGLDIITDGELRRDNMVDYFAERLPGVQIDRSSKKFYYDFYDSAVAGKLPGWGFRSAAQRTFQGQSKRLQIVISRTVQFDSPAGARAYLNYLRANANTVYGVSTQKPQSNRGRSGVVVHPQACACHMAAATFMGLLQDGSRVSYLSLTGPKASASLLQQLETLAP